MALGFGAMALATNFFHLLALTLAAGIGGAAQHPLASAVVSRAYEHRGRATALSTLNFTGDVGKFLLPSLGGILALAIGWRLTLVALGGIGVAGALVFALAARSSRAVDRPREETRSGGAGLGIRKPGGFAVLSAIGAIDNGTRASALTFLPFLLTDKGLDPAAVSFLITLVFAAGAAGKFGCGLMADRWGTVGVIVVTEAITAAALFAVIPVDPLYVVPVLATFGFVLNGTSSALYTAVAEMVPSEARARGFGLFYTISLGIGTMTPVAYGALADRTGVTGCMVAIAAVNLVTIPLAVALRRWHN
jgi:MFS family permease